MFNFTLRLALILACLGMFSVQSSVVGRVKRRARSCRKEFYKMRPHTMCLDDNRGARAVAVSRRQQHSIVDLHNKHRAEVNPSATDLTVMIWDDDLAEVAEKWAMQCHWDHDKHKARAIPGWDITIGQNMAKGHRSWESAINAWQAEVKDYRYGYDPKTYLRHGIMIGHYTQIVQSGAQRVGCGQADCSGTPFYVCNYAMGQSKLDKPYTAGRPCSACGGYCRGTLCDCGGRICKNGGTLDVSTCTCNCTRLWKGPSCEKKNCPARDIEMCGYGQIIPQNCEKYDNLPHDCPYMCGKCGGCKGLFCKNNGTLNVDTCKCECPSPYRGRTCEEIICPASDRSYCGSSFPPSYCNVYKNVPEECPFMCGKCR